MLRLIYEPEPLRQVIQITQPFCLSNSCLSLFSTEHLCHTIFVDLLFEPNNKFHFSFFKQLENIPKSNQLFINTLVPQESSVLLIPPPSFELTSILVFTDISFAFIDTTFVDDDVTFRQQLYDDSFLELVINSEWVPTAIISLI